MDTRQYLYCLKPKAEYAEKAGVIKGVTVIGKLDIVWKTNLGERGRLQTSQLQRMVFKNPFIHLCVTAGFVFVFLFYFGCALVQIQFNFALVLVQFSPVKTHIMFSYIQVMNHLIY